MENTIIPETNLPETTNDSGLINKDQGIHNQPITPNPIPQPFPSQFSNPLSNPLSNPAPSPTVFPKYEKRNMPFPENPAYNKLKLEEDVVNFLNGKTGRIKLNDYLKTLFPVNRNNAANIGNSRYIRSVLDKLQSENKLKMYNNSHDKLGDTYYPNDGIQSAQYNLDTCSIEVE